MIRASDDRIPRESMPSERGRQTGTYRVYRLVTGHTSGTTICPSSRNGGDRKDREGRPTGIEGGRYIIAHHSSLVGICQPGEGHWAGNVGRGTPGTPTIGRRHVANVEFAGRTGTTGRRIVVVGEDQVSCAPRRGFIDG